MKIIGLNGKTKTCFEWSDEGGRVEVLQQVFGKDEISKTDLNSLSCDNCNKLAAYLHKFKTKESSCESRSDPPCFKNRKHFLDYYSGYLCHLQSPEEDIKYAFDIAKKKFGC